ncbi:MAG: hypothetical protein CBD88_00765 [Flavobacteriales bacterium TMED228]|jgi:hypothetical protein|nr:MAG: hypothetical protein CBD88_00765 [Flavobacteriales bacterium TMED228]|tara:strand:- start:82 stop:597 length:516 start_codon:yes stop_codon:yes gene_type:complete
MRKTDFETIKKSIQVPIDRIRDHYDIYWGAGRLLELANIDLRQKFLKQENKYQLAVNERNVDAIKQHGAGLIRGYEALNKYAIDKDFKPEPEWSWTAPYKDSKKTITVCRTDADAKRRGLQGKAVFSLREVISFIPEQILDIRANFTTSDIENVKSKVDEPFDDPLGINDA